MRIEWLRPHEVARPAVEDLDSHAMRVPATPVETWLRPLVESSPDGILVVVNLAIQYANLSAAQLCGKANAESLIGWPLVAFFHPDSHAVLLDRIDRALRGDDHASEDVTRVRMDKASLDLEVHVSRLGDADVAAVGVVLRDVTERYRTEAQLRASEERLRLAFAGAKEGVWDWDLDSGHVVYSRRWKEMLGYGEDELPSTVQVWEALLHPDDRARVNELHDAVHRGHGTYEAELRLRHKDGHYVTVLTRGLPIRSVDDRVVRIVGTHLDITEKKRTERALRESEERLQLAFAGAQEGIWDWDLESNAVVYSSRWKQMLGYGDDEIEPHISAWERLVHPDDRKVADEAHDTVTRGASTYQAEFRLRHKDGHYVHVLSRGFAVRRDAGGPVVRIVGTHFDLTQRREREAERARTELLGRLVFVQEDERRRIARDMHDQFGEHLTALSMQIASLKDAWGTNPDLAEQAQTLETIAERLDRDVEQLVWRLRPTALDDLGLRAALTNYVQEWSARHAVTAEVHTSGLLDQRLASEVETALYRIAQEALNNVAKHARAQRVEVLLERRPDCVLLIVEDDGRGFDASKPAPGRHGFGLVGMQERAALVGATLDIETTPGQGTTILVRMAVASNDAPVENGKDA
jgi:PAS domain S-box-containing protein